MRFLNWLYAELFNYFWLPCPICGQMFGGHECGQTGYRGRVVCKDVRCHMSAVARTLSEGGQVFVTSIKE